MYPNQEKNDQLRKSGNNYKITTGFSNFLGKLDIVIQKSDIINIHTYHCKQSRNLNE